jgi:thiamine transporter ThiT
LGDIVNTGIRFSNFLFAIAGLIFFATFVYAGVRMLFFAYDAKSYSEAKSTMEKAVTGLVIMIMAGTVVRFIFNAFQSDTGGVTTQATDKAATTNSSKTSASTTPTP